MPKIRKHWVGRLVAIGLFSALAMLAISVGGASPASAQTGGVGAAAVPQFPTSVTVGAQDVPVSLLLRNNSTGDYSDDSFRVDQITLTPSCGSKLGFGTCPPGSEDPGVFLPSATGVGRAPTSCAGQVFNITLLSSVSGRYLFTPTTPVTLGPTGTPADTCIIDFTVDVARAPLMDSDPVQVVPGPLQTDQYATVSITDITPGNTFGQTGSGAGSDETTVLRATPQIVTNVSAGTITLGQSFTDTATVAVPAGAPSPTGTVNFLVYGPNDATCAGPPVASSLTRPIEAGNTATSGVFRPPAAGTYRVIATYSGDANYAPVSGVCNDPSEMVVVSGHRSLPAVVNLSANFMLRNALTSGGPTSSFTYRSRPQVPITGDWDGDGTRTAGAYAGGVFYLNNENDSSVPDVTFAFGDPRGFPVVGDYNGDGTEDVAVYRNGLWQVRLSTGATYTFTFGAGSWPATVPVAGDWDGDGTDGIGTYTYATATWALRNSPTGNGTADVTFLFGTPNSSYPVPGDWNGDGTATVGVKTGTTWTLRNTNTPGPPEITFDFGGANELPLTWWTR